MRAVGDVETQYWPIKPDESRTAGWAYTVAKIVSFDLKKVTWWDRVQSNGPNMGKYLFSAASGILRRGRIVHGGTVNEWGKYDCRL